MIYLDSAAVIKMLRREAETPDLVGWLNDRTGTALVSSALVEVEVPRALRRAAPQAFVAFVTYDRRLLDAAKAVGLPVASPGMA